jgi:hypothetical protein
LELQKTQRLQALEIIGIIILYKESHNYRMNTNLFPMKFLEMNGLTIELGEIKIPLKLESIPIRQRPYRLNPIYKGKVKEEINKMLEVGVIEHVEEIEWISPMVVHEKKKGGIKISVDLRKLNDSFIHDPFPTPFTNEFLENVGGQEAYSFTDGFSEYHQIWIALEDRNNKTLSIEWGSFQYTLIPFGLKNVPTIFSRVVVEYFKDFIHKFLKVYLDDWTLLSLLKDHVEVLRLMLERCRHCQISLNINKCIFSAPFGILLGHVLCK